MKHNLYIIKCKDCYKIGHTKNLYVRNCTNQTGSPIAYDFTLYLELSKEEAVNLEKDLHKKLKEKNIKGEWFNCEMLDIMLLLKNHDLHTKLKFHKVGNEYI